MSKDDFVQNNFSYISNLKNDNSYYTEDTWRDYIKNDNEKNGYHFNEDEITWIIEELYAVDCIKEIETMNKADFLNKYSEYIDSLEQGEILTEDEWGKWIRKEIEDYDSPNNKWILEDCHIGWIIERLEEDGYVK